MATQIRLPQTTIQTGFKNKFINPKFDLWNRLPLLIDPDMGSGNDFFTITPGDVTAIADRWIASLSSGSTANVLVDQVTNVAVNPTGFPNSLRVTMAAGETETADQEFVIKQTVEAINVAEFELGVVSSTLSFTLSFYVKSSVAGTYHVCLKNGYNDESVTGSPFVSNTRTYIAPFEISVPNVWEQKEITFVTDSTSSTNWDWHKDSGIGLEVMWIPYGGTSFQTSNTAQWKNDNLSVSSDQAGFETVSSSTFEITGCQLEVGQNATPFEHRPVSIEHNICQNYYQRGIFNNTFYGTYNSSTRENKCWVPFNNVLFNRTPTINAWVQYGNNGVAPQDTGSPTENDYLQITSVGQHSYPNPQISAIYPNGAIINYERYVADGLASILCYWEIESELYSNE